MQTTPAERLILAMLSDIQEHLGIHGLVDPVKIRAAAVSGNSWSLPSLHHEEYTKGEADYVGRVLRMWELIETGIETLAPEERLKLPEGPGWIDGITFPGFYNSKRGNRCWSIAEHMTDDLGLWSRFKGRVNWQHDDAHDLEERYDNMLEAYPLGLFEPGSRPLSFRAISILLDAYGRPLRGKDIVPDEDPPFDITGV